MIPGVRQKAISAMVGSSLLAILASSGMAASALGPQPERVPEQRVLDCKTILENSVRLRSVLASMLADTAQREANTRDLQEHAPDVADYALAEVARQKRRLEALLSQLEALQCSTIDHPSNLPD
jgi:hypothetical protein